MDYAVRAKVYGVLNFGMGVTLRDGDRQYFYEKLEQHFPGLRRKYIENYGNAYEVDSPSGKKLMSVFYPDLQGKWSGVQHKQDFCMAAHI